MVNAPPTGNIFGDDLLVSQVASWRTQSCSTRTCLPVDNGLPVNIAHRKAYLLVPDVAFTRVGWTSITKGETWWFFVGSFHTEVPSPGVAAFIGFAVQAKPVRFESAGAYALQTLPFSFNPGDAKGTQRIGVSSAEVRWLHRHLHILVGL